MLTVEEAVKRLRAAKAEVATKKAEREELDKKAAEAKAAHLTSMTAEDDAKRSLDEVIARETRVE